MPPGERTRKASRRKMIEQSKAEIDYDQLQKQREELAVSERQMEGCRTTTGMPFSGTAGFKWRNVPVSASRNREARILLWLVGSAFLAIMVFIVVFLMFFQ